MVKRGLKSNTLNKDEIKEKLLNNNYYRLSGYSLTIRSKDVFYPDASFEKFFEIFDCDAEMRNILFAAFRK